VEVLPEVYQRQEGEAQMNSEAVQHPTWVPIESRRIDFLYLFACKVQWRRTCSEEAFWELLSARTSLDPATRLVARALLEDC
jgi:hypothetical protein